MPSAICKGCGATTNSAISNYWWHLEPDNKTPKERGVATVCYAAFDAPNNRWVKGCFYDKFRSNSTMTIKIVCKTCGSEDVRRDAWAVWGEEEQEWFLGEVFDYAHCCRCDGECSLEEVELPKDG